MAQPVYKIQPETILALRSSLVQVRMANATIKEIATDIMREIGYAAKQAKLSNGDYIELPWGYYIENLTNPYAYPDCRKLKGRDSPDVLYTFVRDLDFGWLDRVQAYFDAKTKKERNAIRREVRPWEFDDYNEPVLPKEDAFDVDDDSS